MLKLSLNIEGYELRVHPGEFIVLQELLKGSIHHVLGWSGFNQNYAEQVRMKGGY